jgi:hypothetical protein
MRLQRDLGVSSVEHSVGPLAHPCIAVYRREKLSGSESSTLTRPLVPIDSLAPPMWSRRRCACPPRNIHGWSSFVDDLLKAEVWV